MDFSIKLDTVKSGWSIVYIEGLYCISFSEDGLCLSQQCRSSFNEMPPSLFDKAPV